MNDDDLRRHLERRADGAAQPELLPAVRAEIASEPRRLSSSKFPAFAGLAASVVVLVVIVATMPSLNPAAPPPGASPASDAASPTAEPTATERPGIACASLGELHPTLIDSTGLVESCEVVAAPQDGQVFTSVTNPDGDQSTLLVVWSGISCDLASTFTMSRRGTGYDLDFERPVMDCTDEPFRHAMRIALREEVAAADVRATLGRTAEVEAGAAWWELAPHERPTAESTELDLIVYERACAGGNSPDSRLREVGIDYTSDSVTITFKVTPLPGEGDCPVAPGAPYTVRLDTPLGDRRLVDGDDLAGVVVLEEDANFIALATHRVDEYANERFEAMFGAEGCMVTSTTDRYVPTDAEVLAAVEALGGTDGHITGGGYVSEDWVAAARAFGAVEAYAGRPKPWYILISDEGSAFLRTISPTMVAGRTVWNPSDQARLPNRDCEQPQRTLPPEPNGEGQFIECSGAPSNPDPGAVWIEDHTGLVIGCSVGETEPPQETTLMSVHEPPGLTLTWPTPCVADADVTRLEFWSRAARLPVDPSSPFEDSYVLISDRQPPEDPPGCFTMINGRTVTLELAEPILDDDVDLITTREQRGFDNEVQGAGSFTLSFGTNKAEYEANERIDLDISMLYEGPAQSLAFVDHRVPTLFVEQLDGRLVMGTTFVNYDCRHDGPITLHAGEPAEMGFQKSIGYAENDPDAAFYASYFDDPELRLPPGRYRLTVITSFLELGLCAQGPQRTVDLEASVIVTVR
jgi:hypothetical protein